MNEEAKLYLAVAAGALIGLASIGWLVWELAAL